MTGKKSRHALATVKRRRKHAAALERERLNDPSLSGPVVVYYREPSPRRATAE